MSEIETLGHFIPLIVLFSVICFTYYRLRRLTAAGKPEVVEGWYKLEIFLMHLYGIDGFQNFISGILHLAMSKEIAASIGWESNPFQWEVGVANMAFGILGYSCFFTTTHFLPYAMTKSFWTAGTAIIHLIDLANNNNTHGGNIGGVFVWSCVRACTFIPLCYHWIKLKNIARRGNNEGIDVVIHPMAVTDVNIRRQE